MPHNPSGEKCKNQINRGYAKGYVSAVEENLLSDQLSKNLHLINFKKKSVPDEEALPLKWKWFEEQSQYMFCCLIEGEFLPIDYAAHLFSVEGKAFVVGELKFLNNPTD